MPELTIRTACINDYEDVIAFYYNLIDSMKDAEFHPLWEKDVYPTRQYIYDSIVNNELFVTIIDNKIEGAMVINHVCAEGYSKVPWKVPAESSEIMIIHILAVALQHQGRGIAQKMVQHAVGYCRENGIKAIRLDVLTTNKPAEKLYTKMGFVFVDKIQLFYEDTGIMDFLLYELIL